MTENTKTGQHTHSDKADDQSGLTDTTTQSENQEAEVHGDHSGQNEEGAPNPLTELQEKYDTVNDKYVRLYSEFDNYRRRTAKEKMDGLRLAGSDIFKDFLSVADDFDRAITANETDDNLENVKEGFKLIRQKLMRILESRGVKPMDALEKPFDTNFHEAITNIPAPTKDLKGKVVDVAEKGYFFHDQVLRYAKVVVGQ